LRYMTVKDTFRKSSKSKRKELNEPKELAPDFHKVRLDNLLGKIG